MDWFIWSIVPSNENLFKSLMEMEKFGEKRRRQNFRSADWATAAIRQPYDYWSLDLAIDQRNS